MGQTGEQVEGGELACAGVKPLVDLLGQSAEQGLDNLDEQLEAEITQAAYAYCHQNQMHTAQLLGISRNIVRARLLKHGLLKPSERRREQQRKSLPSVAARMYS